ncbi:MAG: hypothetical protein AB7G06_03435 [Bdellovibrionales bacterium]
MTIDWPTLYAALARNDFAMPLDVLAAAEATAPDTEDTVRLGFAVYAQMRHVPRAQLYISKLENLLGPLHSDVVTAQLQIAALVGDWGSFDNALARAPMAQPADPALRQRAFCARLFREGLFPGWQQAVNDLTATPGYPAAHFLKGLHQLAITMFASNLPLPAKELLLKLVDVAASPQTRAAAMLDAMAIARFMDDAPEAQRLQVAFETLRSTTPEIAAAQQQWKEFTRPFTTDAVKVADAVTVIVPTNISRRIFLHKETAPPKIDMIAAVLDAAYKQVQMPRDWHVVITFDQPTAADLQDAGATYKTALESYIAEHPQMSLALYKGHGLRRVFLDQLEQVKTPYIFFLEHDWLFNDTARPVTDILYAMQQNPLMHHCRYNLAPVLPDAYDAMLLPAGNGFTRTNGVSNNPCLLRVEKFRRDWLPIIQNPDMDTLNMGAAGIEENIYAASGHIYSTLGFITGHQAFGTYIAAAAAQMPQFSNLGI